MSSPIIYDENIEKRLLNSIESYLFPHLEELLENALNKRVEVYSVRYLD